MEIRNYTPFVPMLFQSVDVAGREFWTLVLRGTFRIVPFAPLVPDPEQSPIVVTDQYHGEVNASSVRMESDLAPYKPRADIILDATAHAPDGYDAPDFMVRARVGKLEKALRVTGPRRWEKSRGEWRLSDPEPCREVPIRYEHAFGGIWSNSWGEVDVCQENPIGVGYLRQGESPQGDELSAPRIEALEDPVLELGKIYRPAGFGVITRSWLPRRALAGTFDDAWQRERWPGLPMDFDFGFYNGAHPDLVYPGYLRGDEEVELQHLSPEGLLRFSLPDYRVGVLVHMRGGASASATAALDTLAIAVSEERAYLTWRAAFRDMGQIEAIEPRMTAPEGMTHGI